MLLITRPTSFDVMVMENMFGDIISDEAAVLSASLGMLPSASLAGLPGMDARGKPRRIKGLYEPSHGSAPDIAGQGKANPIGSILSTAFMLQYSFGLTEEAAAVNAAVEKTLQDGHRTADLVPPRRGILHDAAHDRHDPRTAVGPLAHARYQRTGGGGSRRYLAGSCGGWRHYRHEHGHHRDTGFSRLRSAYASRFRSSP